MKLKSQTIALNKGKVYFGILEKTIDDDGYENNANFIIKNTAFYGEAIKQTRYINPHDKLVDSIAYDLEILVYRDVAIYTHAKINDVVYKISTCQDITKFVNKVGLIKNES